MDDVAIWARMDLLKIFTICKDSSNFEPTDSETQFLIDLLNEPERADTALVPCTLNGKDYMIMECDGRNIFGKTGLSGFIGIRTEKTLLLAVYDKKHQTSEALLTMQRLAAFLIAQQF